MGELSKNLEIIRKLHKTDLSQLRNLSMLYDMCLAIKDDDIETAKAEMHIVRGKASVLTRTEGEPAVDLYWKATLFLAQNRDVRCYLLYLERYRDYTDRFYMPRMKQLERLGLIQALQDLVDDKLDILTISCPPGVGKAQPLYSNVLTPSGFVPMGQIHVGDAVISGENRPCHVVSVFPQGMKPVYELTFDDGAKCRCSDEHLWKVWVCDGEAGEYRILELKDMLGNLKDSDGRLRYRIGRLSGENPFLSSVEYIGEEECQCIMIDDPCHLYITDDYIITHNTTLAEMFLSGWIGWDPDACNLFSSHSGHVTRMVYDVINNIIGADLKKGQTPEYAWREIFPNVEIQDVNAKEETINLGKFKPFKSITFRAIGASQTGVTRADGLLYCDDLCSGIEEALSKVRLDKLWQKYTTDLKTRKKGGRHGRRVKELHIATRWSVWDVIGRLQKQYAGDPRCEFIAYPDIDPVTGESNWEYDYGVGFDRKYFEDIQNTLDEITYKCLFKNEPVEREGLLFEPDILRRFKELPPGKEPDAIWAFMDPKGSGTDYNCLGVFYQYGADYYMEDVVFRNVDPYILDDLNAACLVRHNVQICQIESNKEGVRTGDVIQQKVKERGGRCVIEKKWSEANKETRIIVNSPWVIQHVLFHEAKTPDNPDGYLANSEYGQFMSHLTSYSQLSKNTNDDAPDMVTMLAMHEGGYGAPVVASIYGSVM